MTAVRMSRAERSLPVVLAGVMFLLVALLLPTILRPADPLTNQAAEFSPDAPPDQQDSIVAALNRGTSATSGTGQGEGQNVGPGELGPGEALGAPPAKGPASRGRCFGHPPRQVESVYAPPCVPAFVGDNGGATTFGATATEFRVAVYVPDTADIDEGPVDQASYKSNLQRTYLDLQNWFNKHFEFYGRQMRLFAVKQDVTQSAQGAAAAIRAKQQFQVFAGVDVWGTNPGTYKESMNQKIVTWMQWQNQDLLEKNKPYGWSFYASLDRTVDIADEVVCKQLAGKPPEFNEHKDTSFDYNAPRKFGLLLIEDSSRTGNESRIKSALAKCNAPIVHTVKFSYEDAGASGIAGAMTQMRAAGATTILAFTDHVTPGVFAGEATRLDYWPEWFVGGVGGADENALTQDTDYNQWRHAIGITMQEIPRAPQWHDDIRAVYEMDPSNRYTGSEIRTFQMLFGVATGVQMAGPKLTPESYEKGMFKVPSRPPDPIWSQGGGYGPGDHFYVDYAMLIWWDPAATAADNGATGSYRYVFDGKHFTNGEVPRDPVPWFKDGILTPADPSIHDTDPSDVGGT